MKRTFLKRLCVASLFFNFLMLGCSPLSALFSGDDDETVKNSNTYQPNREACAGLDLSRGEFTTQSFRKFLACLNSNGAFNAIESLVKDLPEEQLEPLVRLANENFFGDPQKLARFDGSVALLEQRDLLDPSLYAFGEILQNQEFFLSFVSLFKDSVKNRRVYALISKLNPSWLSAMEEIGQALTPDVFEKLVDGLINFLGSPAFNAFQEKIQRSLDRKDAAFDIALRRLLEITQEKLILGNHSLSTGKSFLKMWQQKIFFQMVDDPAILGRDPSILKIHASEWTEVLRTSFSFYKPVTSFFQKLGRPVSCLHGNVTVEGILKRAIYQLVDMQDVSRRRQVLFRDSVLETLAAESACDISAKNWETDYRKILELGESQAFDRWIDLGAVLKKTPFNESPYGSALDFFVQFIASSEGLFPLLGWIQEEDLWGDLVLLMALPHPVQREGMLAGINFLLKPLPHLNFLTVYDLMIDPILGSDSEKILRFVKSASNYFKKNGFNLEYSLRILRAAYFATNVHPIFDATRSVLQSSTERATLYDAILSLAEMPRLPEALDLISNMAKDGRLKQFIKNALVLMRKNVEKGNQTVSPGAEPVLSFRHLHEWSSKDLNPVTLAKVDVSQWRACTDIFLSQSFADQILHASSAELQKLQNCLQAVPGYDLNFEQIVFLRNALGSQLFKGFGNIFRENDPISKELLNFWLGGLRSGQYSVWLDRLAEIFDSKKQWIFNLLLSLKGGAKLELPAVIRDLRKLFLDPRLDLWLEGFQKIKQETAVSPPVANIPDFSSSLKNDVLFHLEHDQCLDLGQRVNKFAEVLEDYRFGISNTFFENHRLIRKMDPKKSNSLLKKNLNFFYQHPEKVRALHGFFLRYPAQDLYQAYLALVNEKKVISYLDPELDGIHTRVAHGFDQLEILFESGNIQVPVLGNPTLNFLELLGDAWGDLPPEEWPPSIQRRFKFDRSKTLTLKQAVEKIENNVDRYINWVGFPQGISHCNGKKFSWPKGKVGWFPGLEETQRSLFNAKQALGILRRGLENPHWLAIVRDYLTYLSSDTEGDTAGSSDERLRWLLNATQIGLGRRMGLAELDLQSIEGLQRFLSAPEAEKTIFEIFNSAYPLSFLEALLESWSATSEDGKKFYETLQTVQQGLSLLGELSHSPIADHLLTSFHLGIQKMVTLSKGKNRHLDEPLTVLWKMARDSAFLQTLRGRPEWVETYKFDELVEQMLGPTLAESGLALEALQLWIVVRNQPENWEAWQRLAAETPDWFGEAVDFVLDPSSGALRVWLTRLPYNEFFALGFQSPQAFAAFLDLVSDWHRSGDLAQMIEFLN